MSHAQTRLLPSDVSLLTIGWEQSWMHTANAAAIASCEAAQRSAGMAHSRAQTGMLPSDVSAVIFHPEKANGAVLYFF